MSTLNPMLLTIAKLERRVNELEKYRHKQLVKIPEYEFWIDEEAEIGAMPPADAQWGTITLGERWKGRDVTAWMRAEVTVPAEWAGQRVLGLFDFGKTGDGHNWGFESLLYVNGEPYQGVGTNHMEVFLTEEMIGQRIQLLFKVWSGLNGDTGIRFDWEHEIRQSALAILDVDADDFYYTSYAVRETLKVLHENSYEYNRLLQALDRAYLLVDWRQAGSEAFYRSISAANEQLKADIDAFPKSSDVTVRCIGHTHIDVAWLWRLKHTREKAARSFSTVLRLMEQFPEYTFLQTQPQLYDDLQRDYPQIYEKIEERVQDGRWEAGGAMWLESDCNIPSGESLVRQLVYGQRFYEQRFGAKCEYLWLPDVFGYSWALPQILKKAGLRYFMTTKISWSVYNRFPHDTFKWIGIDGTEILTHYITTPDPGRSPDSVAKYYTYNGQVLPQTVAGIWNDYRDKEINNELLLSFGYGDGGGGPTRTMLEMRRRLAHMPGLPKVTIGRADEFFNKLEENVESTDRYVHRWDGELYLELHRGTYTSQAYVKKMNRYMENLLRDAELVSSFYSAAAGFEYYAQEAIYESWKIVLRNQFHDILPGSSIAEVYEDCHVEYAEAEQLAAAPLHNSLQGLAQLVDTQGQSGYLIFNSLGWAREELIELDHKTVKVAVPAMGYTFVSAAEIAGSGAHTATAPITITANGADTPFYALEWNAHGQISRLYDKHNDREVLLAGEVANRFDVHEDKPTAHDAWEIDIYYYEKKHVVTDLTSVAVIHNDEHRAVIRFEWQYERSVISQDMIVYADNPRIDFKTHVSWHEPDQLLKVAFPVNIRSTSATYEIQYGNVQRPTHWNTSWDYARFETCAQRWIDLSERDYGVSLLNDCKYGHDVREQTMRLTLIKAATKPDATADIGEHDFTYSLLPHSGDWFTGGTQQQAQRLNTPLLPVAIDEADRPELAPGSLLPAEMSFFTCDSNHVVVDTIKKAEDSDDIIVRCYEFAGKRGAASFGSHARIEAVEEVNLMEREEAALPSEAHRFSTYFKPYELKTFRIRVAKE